MDRSSGYSNCGTPTTLRHRPHRPANHAYAAGRQHRLEPFLRERRVDVRLSLASVHVVFGPVNRPWVVVQAIRSIPCAAYGFNNRTRTERKPNASTSGPIKTAKLNIRCPE